MLWARSQYSGSANIGTWPASSGANYSQRGSLACRPHDMTTVSQAGCAAALKDDCMPCKTTAWRVEALHAKELPAMQTGCASRIDWGSVGR